MSLSSAPAVTQAHSGDEAWRKAFDRLDPDIRQAFAWVSMNRVDIVGAVLRTADDMRQICIRKQWKFTTPSGKVIVARDVLEKIVGWINRYKAVGDVASQFDTVHAALPWAAFRFLLDTACGDVQAVGLVVTVLEMVARIMARSKIIEEVYIRGSSPADLAQPLEEALVLLFADALVLLAKCIKYLGRSTGVLSAVKLPINDDDLMSLENREAEVLKFAALADTKILRGIDTKIETLSTRTTTTFADLDAKLIRLVDISTITQKALEEDKLKALLGWLSLVPVAHHHKDVAGRRLQGSAAWLIQHPDFRDFLISSSSSILLLHGVRGCGKSTAFSAIVDHLLPQPQANTAASPPCAYFYCQKLASEPERASPACILRSLVKQLAIIPGNEARVAQETREEPSKPTVDECIRHILDLTSANPAYICIDAVDELSEPDRACSASVVKVFLTARDNVQLHALLESDAKIRVTPANNEGDVKAFVQVQVKKAIQSRCLLNGNASTDLVNKISEVLLKGSGEIFLWVKLQVDFLCRMKTEQDILETLEHGLSAHLDQIYDHALNSILALDSVAKQVAQQVISWLLFARRRLQPEALFSILGLDQHLQLSKPERLNIVDVCHNLVMLEKDTNQDIFTPASAHQLLATACLRQCTAGPGSLPFVQDPSPIQDFYHYAAVYWHEHVCHSESTATDTSSDPVSHETLHVVFAESTAEVTPAFIVWLEWIRETGGSLPLYHPLKLPFNLILNPSFSPVHTACVFGVPTILSHLINTNPSPTAGLSEPNSDPAQHTPLYLAAAEGHTKLITLMLSHFPDLLPVSLSTPCGAYGTPLNVAAFRGHEGVVRALLDHLDSSPSETIQTAVASAYSHACRGGREGVANLLAKENHRLGLDLWDTEQKYDRVVKEAVTAGFRDLVAWLMGPEVKPKGTSTSEDDGKGTRERNLLLTAIKNGQVAVVRALLRMGQKWKDAVPANALALAAVAGHDEMLSYLHDEVGGMDLTAEGPFGTALRSASLMGYDRVVRLLLSWDADPTAACARLGGALQAAAQNGHTQIMRLLMDKGADCNQPGPPCGTCLQAAAYYGHRDAVVLLLDQGASMYQDGRSKDALHAAIEGGHREVALLFLERGYNVPPGDWKPSMSCEGPPPRPRKQRPWEKKKEHRDDGSGRMSRDDLGTDSSSGGRENDAVAQNVDIYMGSTDKDISQLELNAAIGNISKVRQCLLRGTSDNLKAAFCAATATGQVEVLEVLLRRAPKQLDFLNKALLVAAQYNQPQSVRLLCQILAVGDANDLGPWVSTLREAASSGHTITVRALLECNRPRPSPAVLEGLASVIRVATAAKRSAAVHALWEWILDGVIDTDGPNCGKLDGMDLNEQASASFGKLLVAALRSENADAVESLLVAMERRGFALDSVMPAFASACRDGSHAFRPLLSRRSGKLALKPLSLFIGTYTAAIFGHCKVLGALLDELLERGISLSRTTVVDTAFVGAGRHGHTDILETLVGTPRFRNGISNMQATVNHSLMAAAEAGHSEVVRFCLQTGADISAFVSLGQDMVYLDPEGQPAVEISPQDKASLRKLLGMGLDGDGPHGYCEWSLTGLTVDSVKTIHDARQSHRPAGNGLHMALKGFRRPHDFSKALQSLPATDEEAINIRQERLVFMMLENGCDPRTTDGSGQSPIEMAARWANERVVQRLFDAGMFAPTSHCEDKARLLETCIRLASQNRSATAFRVVLAFLRAGANLPTTNDRKLTTEMVATLQRTQLLVLPLDLATSVS
ncbi:uncharacterized protein B0H64DRAFT_464707 [Chaetomium fimeti]|uniref:Nephrocystin 3-like N-terminal domain-containing protein n=1 Tax=Chaetomium fimeti TaxID=1854472 RepID=A0AAE0HAE7_9PEZI|nr:hypothetical protein B0H64DRAFT_464707 [Chaetomium fimeti]